MKTFNEWLEENHPECLVDEGILDSLGRSKFVRNAVATAGLVGAGLAGEEGRKAIYEPHNSIIPSVRVAAYEKTRADMNSEKIERERKKAFLQAAIEKFERGEVPSKEERAVLGKSGYLDDKMHDHEGRKVTPDPNSQAAIAKRMGKTLVYPYEDGIGERVFGQTQKFPRVNAAPGWKPGDR